MDSVVLGLHSLWVGLDVFQTFQCLRHIPV